MTEWEVIGVLIVLIGFVGSVMAPVLKLNSTIARLSTLIDGALQDMKELKETDMAISKHAAESHQRIHDRIDEEEDKLHNHEVRICNLEQKNRGDTR